MDKIEYREVYQFLNGALTENVHILSHFSQTYRKYMLLFWVGGAEGGSARPIRIVGAECSKWNLQLR